MRPRGSEAVGHDGGGMAAPMGGNSWMADVGSSRGGRPATELLALPPPTPV